MASLGWSWRCRVLVVAFSRLAACLYILCFASLLDAQLPCCVNLWSVSNVRDISLANLPRSLFNKLPSYISFFYRIFCRCRQPNAACLLLILFSLFFLTNKSIRQRFRHHCYKRKTATDLWLTTFYRSIFTSFSVNLSTYFISLKIENQKNIHPVWVPLLSK